MTHIEQDIYSDDVHPIDIVEHIAQHQDWAFDRVADDQIAMAVEGQWRNYSITLTWSDRDETLRLICTFEMEPRSDRLPILHDLLNRVNDQVWTGAFSFWEAQRLMVFRYGLVLAGGQMAGTEQIGTMIGAAVGASERFYPAFQLAVWGQQTPQEAMQVAIGETYGHA